MAVEDGKRIFRYGTGRQARMLIVGGDNPLFTPEQQDKIDAWWNQEAATPFAIKVQMFGTDQGARAATRAGYNVELDSHWLEEDSALQDLREVIRSGQHMGFSAKQIMDRAKRAGRELSARESGQESLIRTFIGGEFAELLGETFHLSQKNLRELKKFAMQHKFEVQ